MKPYYITITSFFPSPSNSREFFVFEQIKAIQKQENYNVVVFKPKAWSSKEKDYEIEGIKVYPFKTYNLPSAILPGLFNTLSIWSFKLKLKNSGINPKSIKIVHSHVTSHGIYANFLKKSDSKIKSILQHHGFDVLGLKDGVLNHFRLHREWVLRYATRICNRIDLHIGVSQKTLNYLKFFKHINIKDSYVLYNGVDSQKFYPIPGLKDPLKFTIGCVAIYKPLKDQITLLKAGKILVDQGMENLYIKLVGTGPTFDYCKQFVCDNGMEAFVEFIPKVEHKDLVLFYNSLDLFVMPSYYEAFGCVYTEAYSCGVPFIAVKHQGIAELIPDEDLDKWLIDKENTEQLAQIILRYKNNR
jgi:glycosyltransferase involved in cell wall biosynthesis